MHRARSQTAGALEGAHIQFQQSAGALPPVLVVPSGLTVSAHEHTTKGQAPLVMLSSVNMLQRPERHSE
jgi:hypothetical protein